MVAANQAGFVPAPQTALPVQPQNGASFVPNLPAPVATATPQDNASFAPTPAPVVNNTNGQAPPAVVAGVEQPVSNAAQAPISVIAPVAPTAMAAAGSAAHMAAQAPADVTAGAQPMPQVPIVQNAQNGYMPGPQQVQGSDGSNNNVHFGEVGYDPFANAISGGAGTNNAWK